jgi:hypothetical protein
MSTRSTRFYDYDPYISPVDRAGRWIRRRHRDATGWISRISRGRLGSGTVTSVFTTIAVASVVVALWAVLALLAGLARMVAAAAAAAWGSGSDTAAAIGEHTLTQLAATSVETYLAEHTAGLAVDPTQAALLWLLVGLTVALLAAVFRARGAQVCWPLWGAATAAMAWHGAESPHQPVAAGVVLAAWGVATLVVWRRPLLSEYRRTPVVHVHPTPTEAAGGDRDRAA